jgi:FHA domain-containing protein
MPSVRTSALWEQYARRHGAVSAEAQDHFKTLFGPAFLAAYEKEVERFNDGITHG